MIQIQTAKVFYSPAAGRRFFTKKAAISAEATCLILKKYPPEPFEHDNGAGCDIRYDDPDRYEKLHKRLCRLIKRAC